MKVHNFYAKYQIEYVYLSYYLAYKYLQVFMTTIKLQN